MVHSPGGKLTGFVSLRDLIMAKDADTVGDIMKTDVVSVTVDTDQEQAALKIREYDLLAIPVVDREDHLVGLITVDDAVDIMEEEVTEDIEQMAGITVGEEEPQEYLDKSVASHFKGRVSWLAVLAACFLVVASIITSFEDTLSKKGIVIVAFLPLVLATGASVGGQTSALVIRGLATRALAPGSIGAVLWKELRVGFFLAIALGLVAFALVAVYAWLMPNTGNTHQLAGVAITVALVAHVVTAALLGAFIPLLVARLGYSPEVFSHPALNAVADGVAVVIYLVAITLILTC